MQHTFFQKLILTVLAGAVTAAIYVYFYEGVIVSAERAVALPPSKAAASASPQ